MNITSQTIKALKDLGYTFSFVDYNYNETTPENAESIQVGFYFPYGFDNDAEYIGKSVKATKKETTLARILDAISLDKAYKSFALEFSELLPCEYKNSINVYATTYGIGIFCLFNSEKSDMRDVIESILKKYDIEYTNEYSDAHLVYRYKISKAKHNIEKFKVVKK